MNSAALAIDLIILAAGETRLVEYVKQTFPPEVENLGYYRVDNAADWLDVDGFTRWLSQTAPQNGYQSGGAFLDATSPRSSEESRQSYAPSQRRIHSKTEQ
ncbi:hypothetical protein K438DRAFT_1763400 [Mycena galopus ATCC 62051]|nr:hypothetical protein K438DRAFT_1763400 [Mycena galopus ATCC 62051]